MPLNMLVLSHYEPYSHVPCFLPSRRPVSILKARENPWAGLSFILAGITFSLLCVSSSLIYLRDNGGCFTVTWRSIHCGYLFGITWQWTEHDEMWFDRAPERKWGAPSTDSREGHVLITGFDLRTLKRCHTCESFSEVRNESIPELSEKTCLVSLPKPSSSLLLWVSKKCEIKQINKKLYVKHVCVSFWNLDSFFFNRRK